MARASVLSLVLAGVLFIAAPAYADRPGVPSNLTQSVVTDHFVVHYTTQAGDPNAVTDAAAQQLARFAERSYGDETGRLGMPPPKDDGDGKTDVYVFHDA